MHIGANRNEQPLNMPPAVHPVLMINSSGAVTVAVDHPCSNNTANKVPRKKYNDYITKLHTGIMKCDGRLAALTLV